MNEPRSLRMAKQLIAKYERRGVTTMHLVNTDDSLEMVMEVDGRMATSMERLEFIQLALALFDGAPDPLRTLLEGARQKVAEAYLAIDVVLEQTAKERN